MKAPARRPPVKARPARRREQLSDEVAAHLRIGIITGALRPGSFIRLDETAAEQGVSITPVREALRTLRAEGMVYLEPHRGHVVAPFSRDDVQDIFWLQSTIATRLVRTAARRITEAELTALDEHVDVLAAAVERHDGAAVIDAEFGFFRTLNLAAGRVKLAWFLLHATRYLPSTMYADDPFWGAEAVAGNRALVAALRSRDEDAVGVLIAEQYADGARRLTARLDEQRLWP